MATAAEHDGHPVRGFPGMLASDTSTGLPHMRPALPPTSIGSRANGVVAGQCCVEEPGPQAKCIEVESNHLGLSLNLLVGHTTADYLAQPKGRWKPFDRVEGARAWLYRDLAPHGLL
jgi:hypothetical protein